LSAFRTTHFSNQLISFSSYSSCNNVWKWLSSLSLTFELMNSHSGINDNNKKDRTKATAAIPMVWAIVTAALLLSGLALIGSYQQPAIAQEQNMTAANATAANVTAANVTAANATAANATAANVTAANVTAANATGTTGGNATNMTTGGATDGTEGEGGGILEGIFGGGGG
jgi:uncharacterized protein YjbI with pentapeptide repeats